VPYKSGLKIPEQRKEREHQKTGIKKGDIVFFFWVGRTQQPCIYAKERGHLPTIMS